MAVSDGAIWASESFLITVKSAEQAAPHRPSGALCRPETGAW